MQRRAYGTIIFLIAFAAVMPSDKAWANIITKFYLHDATTNDTGTLPGASTLSAATVSVTATGAGTNRTMNGTIGTLQVSQALTANTGTSLQKHWFRRWVSDPMSAQTLPTGTWTYQLGAKESNANANEDFGFAPVLKVWRPSGGGSTVATILDVPVASPATTPTFAAMEPGTSEGNIASTTASMTGVAVQDGDILVIELWANAVQGNTTARTDTVYYDGTTEGSTSSNAAYLQPPAGITMLHNISGTIYSDEGTTPISTSKTVKLAVGTSTPGLFSTTTCATCRGFWGFSNIGAVGMGTPIFAWVDGDANFIAAAITKASSTANNIATSTATNNNGLNLYQNRLIVRHEGTAATSTTIADLAQYDADNAASLPYLANGGTLTVMASTTLYVAPGSEFAPGGAVTVAGSANNTTLPAIDGTVKLAVGLRQDKVGTSSILTLGSNNLTLAGSLFASSTSILSNSGTITFNATTTGRTIIATSSPLGNVTFNGVGGAWAFNAQASTTNLTITNGTVTAPSLLTINGNYSNSGTFTHNSGTIYFSGTANTLTSGGSSFNDVQVLSGASYALQDAMPIAGNLTLAGSLTGGSAVKLTGASKNLVGGNATLHSLWLNGSASYTLATSDLTVSTSTIESGATLTVGSGINLIATTTMTLLGTLASASLGNGTTTFGNASYACSNVPSTGTLSSNIRLDATAGDCTMPALSYSGNVEAYNNSASNRTVTMAGAVTLSGTANLFVNANSTGNAILAGPSAAVTVGGDFDFIGTGGGSEVLTTGNNTWTVSGNANFTNGTFVATSGNTWVMSGTTKNLAAVAPFENLTLSGTITLLSNASSTGNVILSGTVTPAGNTLYLLGTGKNITGGSNTIHSLWVQGTYTLITSNLTVSTTTIDSSKSLTIDTGHFLTATSTMTLNGSLLSTSLGNGTTTFGNGSFACPTIPSGGTLTGNVRFDATAGNCTIPGRTYGGNLEAYSNSSSAGRSVIMAGATTISGGLFINAANTQNITFDGATNNPAVTVTGDIDFVGTGSGAEILSTGTGNWVASGNANFTGGTLTAASANWLTMNGANATLTLAGAGSLANFSASSSITISGNATTTGSLLIGSAGTLTAPGSTASLYIGGNYNNSYGGTFTNNSGIVFFNGSSAQTISGATSTSAFNNVTLSGTGGVSFASGNNASTSALTINSGETLTAPSLLTIGGNYTNSGTFTANSGTVYASSSVPQTFSGTMTGTTGAFNNLTILNNSGTNPDTNPAIIFANNASTTATFTATLASTTIRFPASATSTFVNFTLNGQAANSRVWLRSSTAGTPWGLIVTGTQSVSYADVQDSYACDGSTITASNGTNNNSGNNSCWTFAASSVATVTSAANQVFAVSQASTPISQLTITNVSGSAITAANGLRIAIATSTVNMLWDPAFTKAVFGGSASTTRVASAIVGYEGGNSVATITVASDFANGEQLTVSGLNFANFGAAVASSTAIQLFLDGINDQSANAQNTAQYVAITGAQTVANATAGQESNKLANAQPDTTVSNASLFSFRLTPSSENASTTQIVVNLSSVSGYACSNIANLNLYVDYNSNNSVDAGETATGTAACSISGSTGTFTFTTKLATSTARDFVVQADVSGNNFGNTMTLALSAANVTTRGQTSNQPITVTGTVTNATHSQQSTTGGGASAAGSVSPSEVPTFGATTQSGGGATEGGQGGTVNGTGGATNQGGGSPVDLAPLFKPFAGIQLPWNFASALFGFGRFFGL